MNDLNDTNEENIIDGEQPENEQVERVVEPNPIEEEARALGWRPKEEFDRDPENWVDADRFMEMPKTQLRVSRDLNKAISDKLDAAEKAREADMQAVKAANKAAMDRVRQQEQARYEEQLAAIRSEKTKAVELADVDAYQNLEAQEAKLKPPEQEAPESYPEVDKYRAENEWTQNPLLWKEAAEAVNFMPNRDQATPQQQLAFAERAIRDKYPHKFQAPAPKPSRVDSGGLGGAPVTRRQKGASDLPADVRKVAAEFVEEGVYDSVDQYAADYFGGGA